MSQVVVTEDRLHDLRERSLEQERRIELQAFEPSWLRPELKIADLIAKAVGIAVLPVLALWALLVALIIAMLGLVDLIFRGLGMIWRGSTVK